MLTLQKEIHRQKRNNLNPRDNKNKVNSMQQ